MRAFVVAIALISFRVSIAAAACAGPCDAGRRDRIADGPPARALLAKDVLVATAAALGVLTPMPCVPVPAGTWTPGNPMVLIGGMPALTTDSKLVCAWGGVSAVGAPGQVAVVVS